MGYGTGQGETVALTEEAKCPEPAGAAGRLTHRPSFPDPDHASLTWTFEHSLPELSQPLPHPHPQPLFLSGLCQWHFSEETQI